MRQLWLLNFQTFDKTSNLPSLIMINIRQSSILKIFCERMTICMILQIKFNLLWFIRLCIINKWLYFRLQSILKWSITIYYNLFINNISKHTLTSGIYISLLLKVILSFFEKLVHRTFINWTYLFFTLYIMRFIKKNSLLANFCTLGTKGYYFGF